MVPAPHSPLTLVRYFEDFKVGDSFRSRGRTITEADIRLFIGATEADHPNHTDAESRGW